MVKRVFHGLKSAAAKPTARPAPFDALAHVANFRERVERNKTRRGRDDDPPAAQPAPVMPRPSGGGLSGGAAAELEFEDS